VWLRGCGAGFGVEARPRQGVAAEPQVLTRRPHLLRQSPDLPSRLGEILVDVGGERLPGET
jgi:hypothetical protein